MTELYSCDPNFCIHNGFSNILYHKLYLKYVSIILHKITIIKCKENKRYLLLSSVNQCTTVGCPIPNNESRMINKASFEGAWHFVFFPQWHTIIFSCLKPSLEILCHHAKFGTKKVQLWNCTKNKHIIFFINWQLNNYQLSRSIIIPHYFWKVLNIENI
jgi:hypothetical protein